MDTVDDHGGHQHFALSPMFYSPSGKGLATGKKTPLLLRWLVTCECLSLIFSLLRGGGAQRCENPPSPLNALLLKNVRN